MVGVGSLAWEEISLNVCIEDGKDQANHM